MSVVTPKQAAFVNEYLIDLNATQAATRAGYSAKTAGQQGERLLKNVEIAQAVQKAMDERAKRTQIDADYVLIGIKELTERVVKPGDEFNAPAGFKGYELLGRHLELFTDRHKHEVTTVGDALDSLGDDA